MLHLCLLEDVASGPRHGAVHCGLRKIQQLALALACVWPLVAARAQTELTGADPDPASGIEIRVVSVFDALPPSGFAPLAIRIRNGSGKSGVWVVEASSSNYRKECSTRQSLAVESGADRLFEVLVPLPVAESGSHPVNHLTVEVSGPGLRQPAVLRHTSSGGSSGKTATAYTAMSKGVAQPAWGALQKQFEAGGHWLFGSQFDVSTAPSDWRGYSGVDTLWMTDDEWMRMFPAAKNAIRQWVAHGGRLFFCAQNERPELLKEWGRAQPGGDNRLVNHLFGTVEMVMWNGKDLPGDATSGKINGRRNADALSGDYGAGWQLASTLKKLQVNRPLIIAFVVCFAGVVGPLNLFALAKGRGRHRLFWTTPLISIIAIALLSVIIFLHDGAGGTGHRFTAVHLSSKDNEATIVQEQISRTGLLLSTTFEPVDSIVGTPLKLNRSLPFSADSRRRTFAIDGGSYRGDWFSSRAVQAHLLQTTRATRARVEVVNAMEFEAGEAPPIVVSTIPATLKELLFVDQKKGIWRAADVHAGQKKALQPAGGVAAQQWLPVEKTGRVIRELMDRTFGRTGYFYAVAENAPVEAIGTLPSLRWDEEIVLYLGPAADSRTGEPL